MIDFVCECSECGIFLDYLGVQVVWLFGLYSYHYLFPCVHPVFEVRCGYVDMVFMYRIAYIFSAYVLLKNLSVWPLKSRNFVLYRTCSSYVVFLQSIRL
jgi:hypothetical protein